MRYLQLVVLYDMQEDAAGLCSCLESAVVICTFRSRTCLQVGALTTAIVQKIAAIYIPHPYNIFIDNTE